MTLSPLDIHMGRKKESQLVLYTVCKINSRWIAEPNMKGKSKNSVEDNIGEGYKCSSGYIVMLIILISGN